MFEVNHVDVEEICNGYPLWCLSNGSIFPARVHLQKRTWARVRPWCRLENVSLRPDRHSCQAFCSYKSDGLFCVTTDPRTRSIHVTHEF
jgi:hypothetical protein